MTDSESAGASATIPEGFSYEMEMDVRFGDFDSLGHVNHAAYASYCEHVRLKYLEDVLGVDLSDLSSGERGFSMVLANLEVDYRHPITDPDTVQVFMRVGDVGTSSVLTEFELHAGGDLAATVSATLVCVDTDGDGTRPLREEWVEAIEAQEGREFDRE